MKTYRLPNSKITTSFKVYVKAWKKYTHFLKNNFNLRTMGVDPNFQVCCGQSVFILPTWFVINLKDKIDSLKTRGQNVKHL